eukprot:scaffold13308_cov72-Skeletonema_dohrnii-CCMP3373.AAC.1
MCRFDNARIDCPDLTGELPVSGTVSVRSNLIHPAQAPTSSPSSKTMLSPTTTTDTEKVLSLDRRRVSDSALKERAKDKNKRDIRTRTSTSKGRAIVLYPLARLVGTTGNPA